MKRFLLLSFLFSLLAFGSKAQSLGCVENSVINMSQFCPAVVDSVWGCDGNCYLNPCEALFHSGVTHFTHDQCGAFQQCHADFTYSDFGGVANFIDSSFGSGVGTVSYVYEFGDGDTSHNGNPSHTYATAGYYLVCLTISDPVCTSTSCRYILAPGGGPCTPMFTASTYCGLTTFTDQSSPANYSVANWDFGDNSTTTAAPGNITHTYDTAGTYLVFFTMVDSITGCNSGYSATITVTLPEVSAGFTYTSTGLPDNIVTFANTSTGAETYNWDFGDGATDSVANPTHDYAANCNYTVVLTAFDSAGCTSIVTAQIDACNTGIPTYSSVLNSLSVYPNPAKENINVVLNSRMASDVVLTVKDVTGRNVVESTPIHINAGKNNYNLKLPALSAGVYMIQISDDYGMMNTRVLIK